MTKNIFAWLAIVVLAMTISTLLMMMTRKNTKQKVKTQTQTDSSTDNWRRQNAQLLNQFIKNSGGDYDTTALHIVDPWDCLQQPDTTTE